MERLGLILLPIAREIAVPCRDADSTAQVLEQLINQARWRTHGGVEQAIRLKKLTAGLKPAPDFFIRAIAADLCAANQFVPGAGGLNQERVTCGERSEQLPGAPL